MLCEAFREGTEGDPTRATCTRLVELAFLSTDDPAARRTELQPRLSTFPTMYRLHVVPFFEDYWRSRLASEPQAFIDSVRTEGAIIATKYLDIAMRPKAGVAIVARELILS